MSALDLDDSEDEEEPEVEVEKAASTKQKDSGVTFCDDIVNRLIRKCWNQDPEARPSFY